MKRIAAVAIAVAMLAFPGVASAARFKGTDAAGGTIRFRTVSRHGRIVKVKKFFFSGIPMACTEGNYTVTNRNPDDPLPAMSVSRKRKFHGAFKNPDDTQHSHVSGRFRRSFRRASGTFEFDGDFTAAEAPPVGLHNCETGDTHFRVHRL